MAEVGKVTAATAIYKTYSNEQNAVAGKPADAGNKSQYFNGEDEFIHEAENQNTYSIAQGIDEYVKASEESRINYLKDTIFKLITNQSENIKMTMVDMRDYFSDEDIEAAKAAVADGGELSVEAVSKSILDMAKALSGGDASKFDLLKDAFLDGFNQAEKAWGDTLPEISYKTKEAVLAGFDQWYNELHGITEENTEAAKGQTTVAE